MGNRGYTSIKLGGRIRTKEILCQGDLCNE